MSDDNVQEVDRAMSSDRAKGYNNKRRREQALMMGSMPAGEPVKAPEPLEHFEEAPKAKSNITAQAQPAVAPTDPDESIIRIKDKKQEVAMVCRFTGKSGRIKKFSVSMTAVSVNVTDNGVAIVFGSGRVSVEPPVMEPMEITVDKVKYPVIFTGGMQEFGPFSTMYFTRLLSDVQPEEKESDTEEG